MPRHLRATWPRQIPAAISRRRTLVTLGGAALASVIAGTEPTQAGKLARKARQRSRKKCRRQIDQCRDAILDFCASEVADCAEDSLDAALACCSHLSTCKAGAALDCFFASS